MIVIRVFSIHCRFAYTIAAAMMHVLRLRVGGQAYTIAQLRQVTCPELTFRGRLTRKGDMPDVRCTKWKKKERERE